MGAFLIAIEAEHGDNECEQNSDRHHETKEHFLVEIIGSKRCLYLHLVGDIVIDLFRYAVLCDLLCPSCIIQNYELLTVQLVFG